MDVSNSANPDAFARAAFWGGLRVVGAGFLFDDYFHAVDGRIGLGEEKWDAVVILVMSFKQLAALSAS